MKPKTKHLTDFERASDESHISCSTPWGFALEVWPEELEVLSECCRGVFNPLPRNGFYVCQGCSWETPLRGERGPVSLSGSKPSSLAAAVYLEPFIGSTEGPLAAVLLAQEAEEDVAVVRSTYFQAHHRRGWQP